MAGVHYLAADGDVAKDRGHGRVGGSEPTQTGWSPCCAERLRALLIPIEMEE